MPFLKRIFASLAAVALAAALGSCNTNGGIPANVGPPVPTASPTPSPTPPTTGFALWRSATAPRSRRVHRGH